MPAPARNDRGASVDLAAAQRDRQLAVAGGVDPADRAGVAATVAPFERARSRRARRRVACRRRRASGAAARASSSAVGAGSASTAADRRDEVGDRAEPCDLGDGRDVERRAPTPASASTIASTTNRCSRRVLHGLGRARRRAASPASDATVPAIGRDSATRAGSPDEQLGARADEVAGRVHEAAGLLRVEAATGRSAARTARRPRRRPRARARPSRPRRASIAPRIGVDRVAPAVTSVDGPHVEPGRCDRRATSATAAGPISVVHARPSGPLPTTRAGTTSSPSRAGSPVPERPVPEWNGSAPDAIAPVPGRPTASSTSTRASSSPASPAGTRATSPAVTNARAVVQPREPARAQRLEERGCARGAPVDVAGDGPQPTRRVRAARWSRRGPGDQLHRAARHRVPRRAGEPGCVQLAEQRARSAAGTPSSAGGSGTRRASRARQARRRTARRAGTTPCCRRGRSRRSGSAASSAANRPPGRSTRAHSANTGASVDEVAQREAARDAVERPGRGSGSAAASPRTSGAVGARGAQHAGREVDADRRDSRRRSRSRQRSPVPHARSSTREPRGSASARDGAAAPARRPGRT